MVTFGQSTGGEVCKGQPFLFWPLLFQLTAPREGLGFTVEQQQLQPSFIKRASIAETRPVSLSLLQRAQLPHRHTIASSAIIILHLMRIFL